MKAPFYRFIAILLLVIPGLTATYGFLSMKDAFSLNSTQTATCCGEIFLGFILFLLGVAFIGGWTFFRDRKRNYLAPKFKAKRRK